MDMIMKQITIKNAFIEKYDVQKYYGKERKYDYLLMLNEKQFRDFRERGFPAKQSKTIHGDYKYWIRVRPCFRNPDGIVNYEITDDMEEKFLYRDDIEIEFDVHIRYVVDHVVIGLYFNPNDIRETQ